MDSWRGRFSSLTDFFANNFIGHFSFCIEQITLTILKDREKRTGFHFSLAHFRIFWHRTNLNVCEYRFYFCHNGISQNFNVAKGNFLPRRMYRKILHLSKLTFLWSAFLTSVRRKIYIFLAFMTLLKSLPPTECLFKTGGHLNRGQTDRFFPFGSEELKRKIHFENAPQIFRHSFQPVKKKKKRNCKKTDIADWCSKLLHLSRRPEALKKGPPSAKLSAHFVKYHPSLLPSPSLV